MITLISIILALYQPIQEDTSQYYEKVVTSITLQTPSWMSQDEVLPLIDIKPGFVLHQEDTQNLLARIYSLSKFKTVEILGIPHESTVELFIHVEPILKIGDIHLANAPISSSELFKFTQINTGDEITQHTFEEIEKKTIQYLSSIGYNNSKVIIKTKQEQDSVHLNIEVIPGKIKYVHSIRFSGSPNIPLAYIYPKLAIATGERCDFNKLEATKKNIIKLYQEHDFYHPDVDIKTTAKSSEQIDIEIFIDSHKRTAFHFYGNTIFPDQTLRRYVQNSFLSDPLNIQSSIEKIVSLYKYAGYFNIKIEHKMIQQNQHDQFHVFNIIESNAPYIENIIFQGADAFPRSLLMKHVYSSLENIPKYEEENLFTTKIPPLKHRWITSAYQNAAVELKNAYYSLGYLEANVSEPILKKIKNQYTVYFNITENKQNFIDKIEFIQNDHLSTQEALNIIYQATENDPILPPLQTGVPTSEISIESGRIALIKKLRENGYLYAKVFSKMNTNLTKQSTKVFYTFEEGPRVSIDHIVIRGNYYTKKSVIQNRLSFKSEDAFETEKAIKNQRAIASLGVFSSVRVRLLKEEIPGERKDLLIDLKERNRHLIEIIPGISTADGPRLRIAYSHFNLFGTATNFTSALKINRRMFFDLFGEYGKELKARYNEYKGIEQLTKGLDREARIGFRLPPWFKTPLSPTFRIDAVHERYNAINYALETSSAIFGIDMIAPQKIQLTIESSIGLTNLDCPTDCSNIETRRRRSINRGGRWMYKAGPNITIDRRDNPLSPSKGYYFTTKLEAAGGGYHLEHTDPYEDFRYLKTELAATSYFPLYKKIVLALSGRTGLIHALTSAQLIPVDERFFLGGRETVRGFVESTMVPQDACVADEKGQTPKGCAEVLSTRQNGKNVVPISKGANTFVLVKGELRIPVWNAFSVEAFVDAGNLWSNPSNISHFSLRLGTGAGIRYTTPVGALSCDIGINPNPQKKYSEPDWQVHFSIGSF